MENTNKTIGQLLETVEFLYILENKTENGRIIYEENLDGYWKKYKYDENNNFIHYENSIGYWIKYEYDENNGLIYYETSRGYWEKYEYDENNGLIYYETSIDGIVLNKINKK